MLKWSYSKFNRIFFTFSSNSLTTNSNKERKKHLLIAVRFIRYHTKYIKKIRQFILTEHKLFRLLQKEIISVRLEHRFE